MESVNKSLQFALEDGIGDKRRWRRYKDTRRRISGTGHGARSALDFSYEPGVGSRERSTVELEAGGNQGRGQVSGRKRGLA